MEKSEKNKFVLVTGADGFIGSKLVERLSEKYQVLGMDRDGPKKAVPGVEYFDGDLTSVQSVERAIGKIRERCGNRLESVVHLAAYYDFSGDASPLYHELTVLGTKRLLTALEPCDVGQFVYSSSLLVMKPVREDGKLLREDSPTDAKWKYPQSKLETERAIEIYARKLPRVIVRIAGVYDEWCHSIPIAQQIARIYEKRLESLFFPGDKTHGQPFIHVEDVAACLDRVIERRETLSRSELFLLAEPRVLSYQYLQREIGKQLHGRHWPTFEVPKILARAGARIKGWLSDKDNQPFIRPWMIDLADDQYPVDLRHVRTQLDWQPQHQLRNTLPGMLERLKADPNRFYRENHLSPPHSKERPVGDSHEREDNERRAS